MLDQNTDAFPKPGIGIQQLDAPHELVDARSADAVPVLLEGAIAGHVLVKNVNKALPLGKPKMLSIFGYDAQAPPTKNADALFQLGYESQPEMAEIDLGYEAHFSQRADEGVIFAGGRSGSNGPAYIDAVSTPSIHLLRSRELTAPSHSELSLNEPKPTGPTSTGTSAPAIPPSIPCPTPA